MKSGVYDAQTASHLRDALGSAAAMRDVNGAPEAASVTSLYVRSLCIWGLFGVGLLLLASLALKGTGKRWLRD
jgi:hypothetical protein